MIVCRQLPRRFETTSPRPITTTIRAASSASHVSREPPEPVARTRRPTSATHCQGPPVTHLERRALSVNLTRRRPTHAHGQRRPAPVNGRTGSVRARPAPWPSPSCSHFARCGVFRISIRRASAHGHLSQDDSMLALGAASSLSDTLPRDLSLRHSIINNQ